MINPNKADFFFRGGGGGGGVNTKNLDIYDNYLE